MCVCVCVWWCVCVVVCQVCQKAGEVSLLKQQLRDSQAEASQRAGDMVGLRGQLKELQARLREREDDLLGLKDSCSARSLQLERCQGELRRTLKEVHYTHTYIHYICTQYIHYTHIYIPEGDVLP